MEVIQRGYRLIKDENNLIPSTLGSQSRFAKEHMGKSEVPLEKEFQQSVNDFLYHLVWTARKLRRGELWVATLSCDWWLKRLLLQMIEWYMHAKRGDEYDTWHEGRFIENWADESIVNNLHSTFAHYDYSDVKSALFSTTDLYTKLARGLAERLGFQYPDQSEKFARDQATRALT
jgi:aminoglycoside 6-adenylyltransferase